MFELFNERLKCKLHSSGQMPSPCNKAGLTRRSKDAAISLDLRVKPEDDNSLPKDDNLPHEDDNSLPEDDKKNRNFYFGASHPKIEC